MARFWLEGRSRTRTGSPRATSWRAMWLPRKPAAPVTSVVIRLGLLRRDRSRCVEARWLVRGSGVPRSGRARGAAAKPSSRAASLKMRERFDQRPSSKRRARGIGSAIEFRRRIGGENQRAVEIELFQLRMKRDHFFEVGRIVKYREADREEAGKLCDANGFDDIGVFRERRCSRR